MNHCVQVVGYAFTDGSGDDEDDEDGDNNSGSGSNSGDNASGDNASREGYWIVRNQWGSYWGMSGYAYVAMGENTCGVLNDMTQAYL
jgi:C1A family cysteine protease